MRHRLLFAAASSAILFAAGAAHAQTLLYSFEAPPVNPDGFGPNGGGVTITQDTIGATDLTHSMKMSVVPGATFVGALTGVVPPALNDPPGADYILFDMTVDSAFTGNFSLVGVTIFGASQPGPGQQFGLQAQFADFEHIDGKGPGTYNNIRIDLSSATHPLTFAAGQSFNQIFGQVGSGPNDLIPTGFQFFLNKSNDAPSTIYIDNVRVGRIPEPASISMAALAGLALLGIRRRARQLA